jgi:hypothetical protein
MLSRQCNDPKRVVTLRRMPDERLDPNRSGRRLEDHAMDPLSFPRKRESSQGIEIAGFPLSRE